VDAGLDFNDPIPPVVHPARKADIIVICDASAGHVGNELQKASAYMQQHNLPFPKINLDTIDKKTINIFKDKNDPHVPTVFYFPRISDCELLKTYKDTHQKCEKYNILENFNLDHETNDGFAKTIHFQYTPEHAERIIRQMELNVRANEAKIIKALNYEIDRRK